MSVIGLAQFKQLSAPFSGALRDMAVAGVSANWRRMSHAKAVMLELSQGPMKDLSNSAAVDRAPENVPEQVQDDFISRKLIRPALSVSQRRESNGDRPLTSAEQRVLKRGNTQEQTHAEAFYFQKQMQVRTPMVVVLKDGEEIHGWIDWYDRNCIKINRGGQPNLLIYKRSVRYMFKAGENGKK